MTQPRIRSRYSVDVLGNIRERLTSLAGFPAFCFEMLQNAEDAKSEWIELRFRDECLEVANGSTFSQDDWDRITEIAHAGKPVENIGTFGVGFTSVFQYTDEPSILSGGTRVTFSLMRIASGEDDTILQEETEHAPGTTFVIPWAIVHTPVRERLDQPTVSPETIGQHFETACDALTRGLLFLKNVKRATIRYGDRCVQVDRSDAALGTLAIRRTIAVRTDQDPERRSVEWFLRRSYPDPAAFPAGAKKPELALALPLDQAGDLSGRLYSFLPTQHGTGLPFHIHGSFFAKSDRKGIERDGESDHVEWNSRLLQEVSELFTKSLQDLIEHVHYRAALRVLPPHNFQSSDLPELSTLVNDVVVAVREGLPLLRDRQSRAAAPGDLFLGTGLPDHLLNVAEACGARFPDDSCCQSIGWLRKFGLTSLQHNNLASLWLFADLCTADDSEQANDLYRDETFRASVYELVAHLLDSAEEDSDADSTLSALCCALGSKGSIVPLNCLWVASELEYQTFAGTYEDDEFWAQSDQSVLPESLIERLPRYGALPASGHLVTDVVFDTHFAQSPERLSRLYDCVVHWTKEGVTDKERTALREAPIWLRADRQFVPLRQLDLPSTAFVDPLDLGVVFSHPLAESAPSGTVQAVRESLKKLGAEPLSFRAYCTKHLPSYVRSHESESDAVASERYVQVLEVLRSELRRFQDEGDIRQAVSGLAIIPSTNSGFRTASELYWPSEVLDAVFGKSAYPMPNHELPDATPSWQELYDVLGIETTPRIVDVVERIKALANTAATKERDESLRHLFLYLDDAAELWGDDDGDLVETLNDVACLPAEPTSEGLATPASCYTSDMRTLVGSQGRCVSFFFRPRAALRDALRLRDTVKPAVVVANLKDRVANRQSVPREIYRFLNGVAADSSVLALRDVPCIDIGEGRVLKGSQIFFEPIAFGKYRFHLPEALAEFTDLFEALGVRHRQEIDPDALVDVLRDVASEWSPGNHVPDDSTLEVIQYVLVELSACLESGDVEALRIAVASIADLKCLPREDGLLVRSSELVLKDHQGYAKEIGERLGSSLIEKRPSTWRVLHSVFGVPMLSDIVEERLCEPEQCVQHRRATEIALSKILFVVRIVESLRGSHPDGWAVDNLENLQLYTANPLNIELGLTACAPLRVGPRAAKAYFDSETQRILLAQGESLRSAAFARAYAQALNPEIELSFIVPLLRTVFGIDDPDELASELSEMGVELLAEDCEPAGGVESEAIGTLGADKEVATYDDGESNDTAQTHESDESDESGEDVESPSPTNKVATVIRPPSHASPSGTEEDISSHTASPGEGESTQRVSKDAPRDSFDGVDEDAIDDDAVVEGERRTQAAEGQRRTGAWAGSRDKLHRGPRQRRSGTPESDGEHEVDRQPAGNGHSGSPYEASQNWFRVRVARERVDRDDDEGKSRRSEARDDTHAREVVIAFELESRGWEAVAAPKMQKGYDVISTDPRTGAKRRIEIKGASSSWTDDATVRLSYSQFHDAHDFEAPNEDYWLYVVDRLGTDQPRVFPIKNPGKSTYWFYLQAQDWADDVSALEPSDADAQATNEGADAADDDVEYLRECVPESLHAIIDALHGHPAPIPQFELDDDGQILVIDIAWPSKRVGIVTELAGRQPPSGWTLLEANQTSAAEWDKELDRLLNGGGS